MDTHSASGVSARSTGLKGRFWGKKRSKKGDIGWKSVITASLGFRNVGLGGVGGGWSGVYPYFRAFEGVFGIGDWRLW